MVPTLLYLLFKKLRKQNWGTIKRHLISRLFIRSNQIIATLVMLLLLISFVLAAQKQSRYYKIMRRGSEIGWLSLEKLTDSNTTTISMGSEVKTSLLFTFSSSSKEISQFRDGKLYYSYVFRKMNGNVKADRHTRFVGNSYEVEDKSDKVILPVSSVTYNTLSMYFQEPLTQKKVYSDNHQRFLDIEKKPDGAYVFNAPDGVCSSFYYTSGVCYKVKLDHAFYSATLILK